MIRSVLNYFTDHPFLSQIPVQHSWFLLDRKIIPPRQFSSQESSKLFFTQDPSNVKCPVSQTSEKKNDQLSPPSFLVPPPEYYYYERERNRGYNNNNNNNNNMNPRSFNYHYNENMNNGSYFNRIHSKISNSDFNNNNNSNEYISLDKSLGSNDNNNNNNNNNNYRDNNFKYINGDIKKTYINGDPVRGGSYYFGGGDPANNPNEYYQSNKKYGNYKGFNNKNIFTDDNPNFFHKNNEISRIYHNTGINYNTKMNTDYNSMSNYNNNNNNNNNNNYYYSPYQGNPSLRNGPAFVSSYYRFENSVLEPFLKRKGLIYKRMDDGKIIIKDCPFCHDTKGLFNNQWKLYIYPDNGRYFCFRCAIRGSWFDLQQKLNGSGDYIIQCRNVLQPSSGNMKKPIPDQQKLVKYIENLKNLPEAQAYLYETRKLSAEVIEKYKVGACVLRVNSEDEEGKSEREDHICITFPWIDENHTNKPVVIRFKTRSITEKTVQRLDPIGGKWGWFGFHTVPSEATAVVVTEGEFDAMAVHQATGYPAISLPSGANCLPVELLEKLEIFKKIYLWMDDDVVGQQAAEKFALKFGKERCYIVKTRISSKDGPKDANDALRSGLDLQLLIDKAQPLPHEQIASFSDLRDEVYRELVHPEQVEGLKSTTFPGINRLLRGHRKGELTIFSGPTGIGKTSILSQLSLDYLTQQLPTLWGSFELHNVRLAKKMLSQFSQKNLLDNIQDFNKIADVFSELPLYFMRFHGSTNIENVLDAMEYGVYVYDIGHVIIDNLQFMSLTPGARGYDKFDLMDNAISKFRKFATTKNVHISLIIHPRKEDAGHALSTSSVFGSAKATQEADNVVMIQQGKYYRYLEITKNRFSGDLGEIPYKFIKSTGKYVELSFDEIRHIHELEKSKKDTPSSLNLRYTTLNEPRV